MAKRVVFKYPLNLGENRIPFLDSSRILDIQCQGGTLQMWVEHDADLLASLEGDETKSLPKITQRTFISKGTGHEFDDTGMNFLRTVQQGGFVWHFYEKVEDANRPH